MPGDGDDGGGSGSSGSRNALLNRLVEGLYLLAGDGGSLGSSTAAGIASVVLRRLLGGAAAAQGVLDYLLVVQRPPPPPPGGAPALAPPGAAGLDVRLFSWQLSYFSGKVRAYLRFKARGADRLRFEDVNLTPQLARDLLAPHTCTHVAPQVQMPDGSFANDSTEIIERVERLFPATPVIPPAVARPRQRLVCKLLELFGDEWLLTAAYHWRWAYSGRPGDATQQLAVPEAAARALAACDGGGACGNYLHPSHRAGNELQWGEVFAGAAAAPATRREAGRLWVDNVMFTTGGGRGGLRALGVTSRALATAFEASTLRFLALFETHLATGASFVLGHRPSLADYGLAAPLYAHLYQDPVPGFIMRTRFPLVAQWCERLHDRGGRFTPQRQATYDPASGTLVDDLRVGGGAGNDGIGEWYTNDEVPETVLALVRCFFEEQWPVLVSTTRRVRAYCDQSGLRAGDPLPSGSFNPSVLDQQGGGPLTHPFQLPCAHGGTPVRGRRMVVPYQVWMLQGLAGDYLAPCVAALGEAGARAFLRRCGNGDGDDAAASTPSLLELPGLLRGCRVQKRGGKIFKAREERGAEAAAAPPPARARL